MPEQLEIVAHGVTAILGTWLGPIVLTRARGQAGAREFALLTGYLVVWSAAIIVQRLTGQPEVVNRPFRAIEDVGGVPGAGASRASRRGDGPTDPARRCRNAPLLIDERAGTCGRAVHCWRHRGG